jgi:hypothetical protein
MLQEPAIRATGVFEGIPEDRHRAEVPSLVRLFRQAHDGRGSPGVVERHAAGRVEQVRHEVGLDGRFRPFSGLDCSP